VGLLSLTVMYVLMQNLIYERFLSELMFKLVLVCYCMFVVFDIPIYLVDTYHLL